LQTFPKPLTPQEERILLEKIRDGDPMARDQLVERNLRLVAHVARKYQSSEDELDDLISIGTIGLLKAAATFDMTKGSKLATYAARCIDNELLMMFRSRKKNVKEVSLYEPIGTDREGNEIHLMDILESQDEDVDQNCEKKENILRLYRCIEEHLTPQEKEILVLRYGLYGQKPTTQRVIAKRLGISRSYVSRLEKNSILKLRHFLLPA
jgi:RNA polymerase sporulation-specific sigma factor